MIILKNKKVLLFNNPKCGSTSLREYMKPYSINLKCIPYWLPRCYYYEYYSDDQLKKVEYLRKKGVNDWKNTKDRFSVIHTHIKPFDALRIIMDSAEKSLMHGFDDYEKICFTRNPWDRVYSLWKMLKVQNRQDIKDFTNFVYTLDQLMESESHPVIRYVIDGTKNFISDLQGNIIVDRVFKIENTNEFTDYMAEKYSIPRENFPHSNSRVISSSSYVTEYNSKTVEIIESRYKWEIDNFGYEFGE
jgi:hypothetical protein